ncbi:MAG: hypothetical protein ABIS18_00705 [Actinomycetota bacterium]
MDRTAVATVDGTQVKIEFLCDLENESAETTFLPFGCKQVAALNMRGTRFVSR